MPSLKMGIAATIFILQAGCAGILLQPTGNSTTASQPANNGDLAQSVSRAITAAGLVEQAGFSVQNNRGYLTLTGVALSAASATRAGQIARDTEGVRGVSNRLQVTPAPKQK